MKVRASNDVWAGFAVLAFAAVFFWQVEEIRQVSSLTGVLGARAFPLALAALLAASGLALVTRFRRRAKAGSDAPDAGDLRMLGTLCAFLVGYLVVLPYAGFTLATGLFLYGLFALLGERRHWLSAPLALALAGALYVSFHGYLGVSLPRGAVGF